ncbi:unnamed protein product [Closterium sp. NIES-65]|nr:unnamed protein product [Closterium sp. NIES-65]
MNSCSIMDCGENAYSTLILPSYTLLYGECVGPATYGSCPTLATCTRVSATIKAPYCPPGYGMTSTSCVQGALPTVSSSSFTFYDKPFYGLSPNTYTTHLDYNACTNVPLKYSSYWRVDHAPGGAGDCLKISMYTLHDCIGLMTVLYDLPLNSIEALGVGLVEKEDQQFEMMLSLSSSLCPVALSPIALALFFALSRRPLSHRPHSLLCSVPSPSLPSRPLSHVTLALSCRPRSLTSPSLSHVTIWPS